MHQIASQYIFISKNFQGRHAPDPAGKRLPFGHLGLLPETIYPREKPVESLIILAASIGAERFYADCCC